MWLSQLDVQNVRIIRSLSLPSLKPVNYFFGENGAGKSTLMSILYGFYKADAGEVFIAGEKKNITDSQAAIAAGIGMVFQHFKLVENFTVLENIILGAEDGWSLKPSLAKAQHQKQSRHLKKTSV